MMNVMLWVVQSGLAFLFLAGGGFKVAAPGEVAKQAPGLPDAAWRLLGGLEVAGAVLLVLPAATGVAPFLTPVAAAVLALESFGLALFYGRRSVALEATNPLVFAGPMFLAAVLVAWGRFGLAGLGAG